MDRKKRMENRDSKKMFALAIFVGFMFFSVLPVFAGFNIVELEPVAEDATLAPKGDVVGPKPILANAVQEEKATMSQHQLREVFITLRGATDYETVEIFNHIIEGSTLVENVERLRLVVVPTRPGQCLATWKILTRELDTFAIESQLYNKIKTFDLANSSDVLEGLFFKANVDDVEQVRRITPRLATASALHFALTPLQVEDYHQSREDGQLLYAGFD